MIVTTYDGRKLPRVKPRETSWQLHCRPERSGVYRRYIPGMGNRFCYYDAAEKRWMIGSTTVKEAASAGRLTSGFQNAPWCGLSENPDAR